MTAKTASLTNRLNTVLASESTGDVIKMDVPLFIRMMELAREDLKTDVQLHVVVEKVITASKHADVLTMDHYESIAPHMDGYGDAGDEGQDEADGADADGEWHDDDDDIDPADLSTDDLEAWRDHELDEVDDIEDELEDRQTAASDAEIKRLKKYIKDTGERIAKYKDWNTTGSHDKKIKELKAKQAEAREKLKALTND